MMTSTHVPRWMKATLAISLAFNMLLGGLIVGRLLLSPFSPFSARPGINMAVLVDRLTDGMTEGDQRVVRTAIQQRQAALIDKLNAVQAVKAQMKDIAVSDSLTKDQLQAVLSQLSKATDELRSELAGLMTDTMPNLSPEGRRKVMRVIEAQGGREGPPWRK